MLIRFKPEVEVERSCVKSPTITLELKKRTPKLENAILEIKKGWIEEDIPMPEEEEKVYYYYLHRFHKHVLLLYGTSLIEIDPFDERFSRRRLSERAYHLSRFAICRSDEKGFVVETPLAPARGFVRTPDGIQFLFAFQQPLSVEEALQKFPHISSKDIRETMSLLLSMNVLTDEEEDQTSLQWEGHDLYFHSRSRRGRSDASFGGTYRFEGKIPPRPPLKTCLRELSIDLPSPKQEISRPFGEVFSVRKSVRKQGEKPISFEQLGEFLYHCARVKKQSTIDRREFCFRPYPAGGALHELELYPVVYNCAGLEKGIYHYHPLEHKLCHVAPLNKRGELFLLHAQHSSRSSEYSQILIVLGARFQRVSWKYESMAYATILKNVGVVYQSMYLVATAMGLAPCAIGLGDADLFCEVMGTDYLEESSVGEFMLGSLP